MKWRLCNAWLPAFRSHCRVANRILSPRSNRQSRCYGRMVHVGWIFFNARTVRFGVKDKTFPIHRFWSSWRENV